MVFDDKTVDEVYLSIVAEVAKATAELRCAQRDLDQASTRLKFVLACIHHLRQRFEE